MGEVNTHTSGTEFYGATGIFAFLNRLRSRAQSVTRDGRLRSRARLQGQQHSGEEAANGNDVNSIKELSIVNYLHNPDYQSPVNSSFPFDHTSAEPLQLKDPNPPLGTASRDHARQPNESETPQSHGKTHPASDKEVKPTDFYAYTQRNINVERACLRSYFDNLHLIHPILEKESFLRICDMYLNQERVGTALVDDVSDYRHARFRPVYCAVLALGAIVAPRDSLILEDSLYKVYPSSEPTSRNKEGSSIPRNIALIWARTFFEAAKAALGDTFSVSSLESTQALFLLVS